MAATRLVSGIGGLARVIYLEETKEPCNMKKLRAEGSPGLAVLEQPTAVEKSGRPRPRSARSSRIASVPIDAARRGCVACDFLVATADREDFFTSRTLAEATQTTCRAPDATQYLTGGVGVVLAVVFLILGEDSSPRCRLGYFPRPFVRFPLVTFGLPLKMVPPRGIEPRF